jgi:L-cysteine:1D-myo-inositol 2-amino-2-deoxy-alpha-D-glucopyranoside ligase
VVDAVLAALAEDLDAPAAVAAVAAWVETTLGNGSTAARSDESAAATVHRLLDTALGLWL